MAVVPVLWRYVVFGDPTYAHAILDRVVHNAHHIDLIGESLRRHAPDRSQGTEDAFECARFYDEQLSGRYRLVLLRQ